MKQRQVVLRALALLAVLPLAAAQEACTGRACSCIGFAYGRALLRFDEAVTCLFIAGQKAVFYPRVDDYAVLELTGLPNTTESASNQTSVWLAVEGKDTVGQNDALKWVPHDKPWSTDASVAPFFTAVVQLERGVVQRVQWDSGCSTCSPSDENACVSDGSTARCSTLEPPLNQCYDCRIPHSECKAAGQCVPRVYVAWLGTDARGNPCTSAGKVISRFRGSSFRGLYDSGSTSSVTLKRVGGEDVPQGASIAPDGGAGDGGTPL
ncbi:hypothetical protein KFE25_012008 [Diacronema lutheri]|uniref:Uncharacterized protein n=1 Tax=Diacronema lutheri TaxID=2081491 RepID=A0A8J6C0I9_DIALT|nr:hypothetical protein KFE25_012008 [Diacronema lutheri]